jgi:glycosyltransferase involved in cell wall biosynthesis
LRVLISAYGCAPHLGSEAAVGWNWAQAAARDHDVWVLTWERHRDSIEREIAERPIPNLHVAYYDLPWFLRHLPASERQLYLLWELLCLTAGRRLQREIGFDVVHHLTYNTVEVPGLFWLLGVPFVWGPVGGGQVPPPSLRAYFRHLWPVEVVRGLRKRLLWLNPMVRMASSRAAVILVSNRETERLIEAFRPRRLIREPEIAMTPPCEPATSRVSDGRLRIAWSGRMMPRKGPLLALDIAEELRRRGVPFVLRMAGGGQWERLLRKEVESRGLGDNVKLLGRVDYREMPRFYREADAFLFTSLQDTSGTVLLEAMASKLPVVALDHQGAADIVDDAWGIKVPVGERRAVVDAFADALQSFAADSELGRAMGEAGRRRVLERYSWQAKADLVADVYTNVTAVAEGG